jgi:hypothetical protein
MNKQDKINFTVILPDKRYNVSLRSIYEEKKLLRYIRSSLSKSGVDILSEAKKFFLDVPQKCPFCGGDSKYYLAYNLGDDFIEITGVEMKVNEMGWINYHCLSGRSICSGGSLNPNSVEYVSKSYKVSIEDARNYILDRNKSPFYRKNHNSDEEYKKSQSRNIDYYIKKYGDTEGRKRYENFSKTMSEKSRKESIIERHGVEAYKALSQKKANCSLSYYISKYGSDAGLAKYEERIFRLSQNTRDNFIKVYGEDKWNDRIEKIRYKTSMEYFINSLGYEDGMRRFHLLRNSYSFTKKDYIEKYGLDKWLERASKNSGKFYSREAKRFFELLLDRINSEGIHTKNVKWLDKEFFLWDDEFRRIYFYDFYFEICEKKIIIEYDNSFWHPKKNSSGDFNKNYCSIFNDVMTEYEKFEYDERKINFAKYKGYEIFTIESSETNPIRDEYKYDNHLDLALRTIKNIIKDKI